jgi:two-component system, NarL family, response regulator LiaR
VSSAIRVILGEDHFLVREGTRHMLAQYPDLVVVGEAGTGQAVLELFEVLQPDVAILDMRMPGPSTIEVTRNARELAPRSRVLILSAYDDDDLVHAAMEVGASGYLLKTVRASELVAAVRAVHRGEIVLHPEIGRKLAALWARQRTDPEMTAQEVLTPRELQVLRCVARGLRNKDVASELELSARTVEGHLSTILSKLGVCSRTEAAAYAFAHGWLQPRDWFDSSARDGET